MTKWELFSLEMDYPGENLGKFFANQFDQILQRKLCHKQKERVATSKSHITKSIRKALGQSANLKLTIYGSDTYHHYTYGICRLLDKHHDDYGYIHIDHHDDYDCERDEIKSSQIVCGTFVKDILQDTHASSALFIGTNLKGVKKEPNKQHLSIKEQGLRKGSKYKKLIKKLKKMPDKVYISIDLDVLSQSAIRTAYDQGTMLPYELIKIIKLIKKYKTVIGADILGYSRTHDNNEYKSLLKMMKKYKTIPMNRGPKPTPLKELRLYEKLAKLIIR